MRKRAGAAALRGAAVEFGVFQGEDVDRPFVAGRAQERRVVTEVEAARRKWTWSAANKKKRGLNDETASRRQPGSSQEERPVSGK